MSRYKPDFADILKDRGDGSDLNGRDMNILRGFREPRAPIRIAALSDRIAGLRKASTCLKVGTRVCADVALSNVAGSAGDTMPAMLAPPQGFALNREALRAVGVRALEFAL